MEFKTNISKLLGSRALRCIGADAGLGASCGTLYGIVFGGFTAIGKTDFLSIAFAPVCIGVIGGITVALVGLFDGVDEAAEADTTPDRAFRGAPLPEETGRQAAFGPVRQTPGRSPVPSVPTVARIATKEKLRVSV